MIASLFECHLQTCRYLCWLHEWSSNGVSVPGGWYHVLNRGNRREAVFRSDTDRQRFLGRLAKLPERLRTEIHAFVLMDNHSHFLLRIQDANLSDAIRWLQVS